MMLPAKAVSVVVIANTYDVSNNWFTNTAKSHLRPVSMIHFNFLDTLSRTISRPIHLYLIKLLPSLYICAPSY